MRIIHKLITTHLGPDTEARARLIYQPLPASWKKIKESFEFFQACLYSVAMNLVLFFSLHVVGHFGLFVTSMKHECRYQNPLSLTIWLTNLVKNTRATAMSPPNRLTCYDNNLNMEQAWNCVKFLNEPERSDCVVDHSWTSMCEGDNIKVVGSPLEWTSDRESVPCVQVGNSVEVVLRECGARGGMGPPPNENHNFQVVIKNK
jgi:hypothetical protein